LALAQVPESVVFCPSWRQPVKFDPQNCPVLGVRVVLLPCRGTSPQTATVRLLKKMPIYAGFLGRFQKLLLGKTKKFSTIHGNIYVKSLSRS